MTGQGQGRRQSGSADITAEVRAVNNRHLKIHLRTSDGLGPLEPQMESVVRAELRRGSLQITVQISGGEGMSRFRLQEDVLAHYWKQCESLAGRLGVEHRVGLEDLLGLPGVISDPRALGSEISEDTQQAVLATLKDALDCLNRMRAAEGDSMARELAAQVERLKDQVKSIEGRAPDVVAEYRQRLTKKLSAALAEVGAELNESDVVREVLVMADRADIREEVVRLYSHFDQFQALLRADESQGRKLDFLIQEMFRETNTIGSKAADAEIAQRVVDMKTTIEQMRELVQNVE